jgi:hypothetical protein
MMEWTEDHITRLRYLAETEKLSASKIAEEFGGVTRNAVIGKCQRAGIKLNSQPGKPASTKGKPRFRKISKALPVAEKPEPLPTGPVHFIDLRRFSTEHPNECRRFIGTQQGMHGFVCGAATPIGKAWCAKCAKRLFAPPRHVRRAA